MMYEENGEHKIALREDEVEQSIACLMDFKSAMENNEKTKHHKDVIVHIQIAIETMMAFCTEHFMDGDE
jgi:hypothetical protein